MSFVYTKALERMVAAALTGVSMPTDIRALLVMTNTTADTDEDVDTIGAFGTFDEFDGSGYSAGGIALTGETTVEDEAQDEGVFDATDLDFGALGAGTRSVAGIVLYWYNGTSVATSTPIAYIDEVSSGPTFPYAANGADVEIVWDAEGILNLFNAP